MSSPLRFASALSAIALVSAIAGCATPQGGAGQASRSGPATPEGAFGTRALIALNAGNYAAAAGYAERAVEATPRDSTLRTVLGNAYFGAGRFASAEAAYRDSLTLDSNQSGVVLKLALVQIAQGRSREALELLGAARNILETADLGLALALAGQPRDAIALLDPAARLSNADSRLRQNLALAHAMAGDWASARVIASQDLSADLVDQRIQQWMGFAKPARAADQVAALTGVTPAAVDPGQPTRLALAPVQSRMAAAAPQVQPQVQPRPQVQSAPTVAAAMPAPVPAPVFEAVPQELAVAVEAPPPPLPVVARAEPAFASADPAPAADYTPPPPPAPPARVLSATRAVARLVRKPLPLRAAAAPLRSGGSTAVVQIGAYGSPERVAAAWHNASRRFTLLRAYSPMSARFNGPSGQVYRLSVKGFADAAEAGRLCASLRRSGGTCFVRSVAGDSPVRMASR